MNYYIIQITTFSQNCILIWCTRTKLAALIDPGGDVKKIKQIVINNNVILTQILLTHGHLDHIGAANELAKYYNIPIIGPKKEDIFLFQKLQFQHEILGIKSTIMPKLFIPDRWLIEGENINIGNITLQTLHCPGHTPGHIVFFNNQSRILISGDVIFKGGIGRSDFPLGDHEKLIQSIKKKLLPLGDDVTFIAGHGKISTIGHERKHNPFLLEKATL